jgi:ABC-type transporter Mla MlaB component
MSMSTPDLVAVDDLCRLARAARRLGCRAHLVGADEKLRSLLELAGVSDILCHCPADIEGTDPHPTRGDLP